MSQKYAVHLDCPLCRAQVRPEAFGTMGDDGQVTCPKCTKISSILLWNTSLLDLTNDPRSQEEVKMDEEIRERREAAKELREEYGINLGGSL